MKDTKIPDESTINELVKRAKFNEINRNNLTTSNGTLEEGEYYDEDTSYTPEEESNRFTDDDLIKVTYCYTLFHSKTLSSELVLNQMNTSVLESYTNILNNNETLVQSNISYGIKDFKLKSCNADFVFRDVSYSLSGAGNVASSVHITLITSFPSLDAEDKQSFKTFLLSQSTTIGKNLTLNRPDASPFTTSVIYFQPVKRRQKYVFNLYNDYFQNMSNAASASTVDDVPWNDVFTYLRFYEPLFTKYWNSLLRLSSSSNTNFPIDVKSITFEQQKGYLIQEIAGTEETKESKKNNISDKNEISTEGSRFRGRPGRGPSSSNGNSHRFLTKVEDEMYSRRRVEDSTGSSSKEPSASSTSTTMHMALPLDITFYYYIPTEYVEGNSTFNDLETVFYDGNDMEEDIFVDRFFQDFLHLNGFSNINDVYPSLSSSASNQSTTNISLQYLSLDTGENSDGSGSGGNVDDFYDDDFYYQYDPDVFQDILETFIVMFVVLSFCLCMVYCGKFQERKRKQKVHPFDGSIPQDI